MRDLFERAADWDAAGYGIALATVIKTSRSSPRPEGSVMLVRSDGLTCGSVSAGCAETSVIQAALDVLASGTATVITFDNQASEPLFSVGPGCGGEVSIFVERCPLQVAESASLWKQSADLIRAGKTHVWSVSLEPAPVHALLSSDDRIVKGAYASSDVRIVEESGVSTFLHLRKAEERLFIVGGVHIAVALVTFAKLLGFHVTVIDPRAPFLDLDRFPTAPDALIQGWPSDVLPALGLDDQSYAVAITHDSKIDDDALKYLITSDARYIGALGSKSSHARRLDRLAGEGFEREALDRIRGPVGLEINALTPEEIALSIVAEMTQVRRGG